MIEETVNKDKNHHIDTHITGLTHFWREKASICHPERSRRITSINGVIIRFFDRFRMTYVSVLS